MWKIGFNYKPMKCWPDTNQTADTMDEDWDTLGQEYMQVFQETASREWAKEKLHHLSFISGDINTFMAQFCTLANEAQYPLMTQTYHLPIHIQAPIQNDGAHL